MKRLIALPIITILTISGCNNSNSETKADGTELTVSVSTDLSTFVKAKIEEYLRNEDIAKKVKINYLDREGTFEHACDIEFIACDNISKIGSSNNYLSIPSNFINNITSLHDNLAVEAVSYHNDIYAFPFLSSSTVFYYDDRILSLEEITNFYKINNACVEKKRVCVFDYTNYYYNLGVFYAAGSKIDYEMDYKSQFDTDNKIIRNEDTINSDNGVLALKALLDIKKSEGLVSFTQKRDQIAGYVGGAFDYSWLKQLWGEHLKTANIPSIYIDEEAKDVLAISSTQAIALGKSGDSFKEELSLKIANYLSNSVDLTDLCSNMNYIDNKKNASYTDELLIGLENQRAHAFNFPFMGGTVLTALINIGDRLSLLGDDYTDDDLKTILQDYDTIVNKSL